MNSEITIISPKSLAEAKELSKTLSEANTIPQALRKSPADVLAIVMAGAELGLAPMQSIRGIVLIQGKPTLSADAMGALVKSRKDVCEYLMLKHTDGNRATYVTKRNGEPEATTMAFTIEEARVAGLTGENWKKYPAAMLRARALSAICRAVYPDLLLGVYDPDEISSPVSIVEKDVTPHPSPPTVVGEIVAPRPSPPVFAARDYDVFGAPLTERAKLEVAIAEAHDETQLNALIARSMQLSTADKAHVRKLWTSRREELLAGRKAS